MIPTANSNSELMSIFDLLSGVGIVATVVVILFTTVLLHFQRRRRISKPTNIRVSDITCDSVTLKWTKPAHGSKYVTLYKIFARSPDDQRDQWQSSWTSKGCHMTVCGLKPKARYVFKVRPECGGRHGEESSETEPVETKPSCPGKPRSKPIATSVTQNSVGLSWGEPEYGGELVTKYVVLYCQTQGRAKEWKEVTIKSTVCHATVDGLDSETEYSFKVRSEGGSGSSPESELSDPVKTDRVLSKRMKDRSEKLSKDSEHPEMYKLPMTKVAGNKFVLGDRPASSTEEKVLMLVGATGGGKSTLLNFIANYALGVQFEDDFRFELRVGENDSKPLISQTNQVAVYTFHPMEGSHLSFSLTIIDTPGFGCTRGSDVDKATVSRLVQFFSAEGKGGIYHLDGVGVVAQASTTQDQKFVFDSVLSTLGKDLSHNVFLMVTSCDPAVDTPPMTDTAKEAKIPGNGHYFKFNNSTPSKLATSDRVASRNSWDMGVSSLRTFFDQLKKAKPVSIEITKDVLSEWQNLEAVIEEIQDVLASGCGIFEQLRGEEKQLKEQENAMEENKNFSYKVKRSRHEIVNLPSNEKALNCLTCSVTCQYPYESTDGNAHGSGDDFCTSCPRKCSWQEHAVQTTRHESSCFTETVTSKEREARYNQAKCDSEQSKGEISHLKQKLSELKQDIVAKSECAKKHSERLNDIAMKPEKLTDFSYLDSMIQMETAEKREECFKKLRLKKIVRMLIVVESPNDQVLLSTEEWWSIQSRNM